MSLILTKPLYSTVNVCIKNEKYIFRNIKYMYVLHEFMDNYKCNI